MFMVPTLGINIDLLKKHGYIGGYSIDSFKEIQYSDAVYVLFKPVDMDAFKTFLDAEYIRTGDIIEDYDYENGHVVVVYSLSPKFKSDFELVKKGKYSSTSEEFQKSFPTYIYIEESGLKTKQESIQYKIFNKSPDLIQYWEEKIGQELYPGQELWGMYEEEKETLKL
jgi:hypothetical protein